MLSGDDIVCTSVRMGTFANKIEGEILRLTARDIMKYNIRAYKYEVHEGGASNDNPVSAEQKPDLSKYIIRLPVSSPIRELPLFKETCRSDAPYVFNRDGIKCLLSHGPVYLCAAVPCATGNICSDCIHITFNSSHTSMTLSWKNKTNDDKIERTSYDVEWLMSNFDGLEMGLMEDDDDDD